LHQASFSGQEYGAEAWQKGQSIITIHHYRRVPPNSPRRKSLIGNNLCHIKSLVALLSILLGVLGVEK
jgi:hypothetical protein